MELSAAGILASVLEMAEMAALKELAPSPSQGVEMPDSQNEVALLHPEVADKRGNPEEVDKLVSVEDS
jgi:hypothetical protein